MKKNLFFILLCLIKITTAMEQEPLSDDAHYHYYCAAHLIADKIFELAQESRTLEDSITFFPADFFEPKEQTREGLILEFFQKYPTRIHMPLGTWKFARSTSVRGKADEILREKIIQEFHAYPLFGTFSESSENLQSPLLKERILLYAIEQVNEARFPIASIKNNNVHNWDALQAINKKYKEIKSRYIQEHS